MLQFLNQFNIINFIWIIPAIFFIHELEEWNILKWYKKFYNNIPPSTNFSIRLHIITLGIAGFLLIILVYFLRTTFIFSIIFIYITTFITVNTIQHIIWTIQYKAYSPGLITGIACFIIIFLINILFISNKLVILPFYLIFIIGISPVINTLKSKHEMTPEVLKIHIFFISFEKLLRKIFNK